MSRLYNLDMLRELVGDDENEIKELVNMFIELTPETLSELNNHFENKNYDGVGSAAHKLKSTIKLWDITEIKNEIVMIELNAKNNENLDKLPFLIEKLNKVITEVIAQLKEDF